MTGVRCPVFGRSMGNAGTPRNFLVPASPCLLQHFAASDRLFGGFLSNAAPTVHANRTLRDATRWAADYDE